MERLKAIPNYGLLTWEISHSDFVTVFQILFILENLLYTHEQNLPYCDESR